jgi:hypothetical protein
MESQPVWFYGSRGSVVAVAWAGNDLRYRPQAPCESAYAVPVAEILIAVLITGVLFISDPDRLQRVLDRLREFTAWLAE